MASPHTKEIRFDGCEMIVRPAAGTMKGSRGLRLLSSQIAEAIDEPRPNLLTDVVFDFGSVHWISSEGLNELIQIQRRTRASGVSIKLRALCPELRDIFRITRLERMFDCEDSEPTRAEGVS